MKQSAKIRYLTKSRYKIALECPTKLFYTGKPTEYPDTKIDDPFLKGLARGRFQVGSLAKCYYSEGIEVFEIDHDTAVAEGMALRQIASILQGMGIPTKNKSSKWHPELVRRILDK